MGLGVVGRCTFVPKNIKTIACFNSNSNRMPIILWQFVLKRRVCLGSHDLVIPPIVPQLVSKL